MGSNTLTINSDSDSELWAGISGSGNFIKEGSGTLKLYEEKSFTGSVTISAGTLILKQGDTNVIGHSSSLYIDSGAIVTLENTQNIPTLSGSGTLNENGQWLYLNQTDDSTFSGTILGNGRVYKDGNGTLTLTNDNSAETFTTIIESGNISLNSINNLGSGDIFLNANPTDSTTINQSNSAILEFSGNSETIQNNIFLGKSSTLNITGDSNTFTSQINLIDYSANIITSETTTISGSISDGTGYASLVKSGAGTLVLSSINNSLDGNLTIQAGTLKGTTSSLSSDISISNNGVVEFSQSSDGTYSNNIGGTDGTVKFTGNGVVSLDGVVSGGISLLQLGNGYLVINGTNTNSGDTYVSNGVLQFGNSSSSVGTGNIIFNGGNLRYDPISSNLTLNSGITFSNDTEIYVKNNMQLSIDDNIINNSSLITKIGNGTLELQGSNNSFNGDITVSAGTLSVRDSLTIGNINILNGTTLLKGINSTLSGESITIEDGGEILMLSGGSGTISNNIILNGSGEINALNSASELTLSGVISGSGSIIKTGSGTAILTATNSYTGDTTIEKGTLSISSEDNLGSENIQITGTSSTAPSTLNITSETTFSKSITLSGDYPTVSNADSVTLSGIISGDGNFSKSGSGTLILSNAVNTYTGLTKVSAGELSITGDISSSQGVTVSSGANLSGDGSLPTVTVYDGGYLSPGVNGQNNGIGALSVYGDLNLNGTLKIEIAGIYIVSDYDAVGVEGGVTLGTNSAIDISLLNNFNPLQNSFRLIVNDGTDGITGTLSGISDGDKVTLDGANFYVSYSGTDEGDLTGGNELIIKGVNEPTIFNELDGNLTYIENGTPILLDNNVTVSDEELDKLNSNLGDYSGASIQISRNPLLNSNDIFGNSGLLENLTENGPLVYNSVEVGTVTTNSNGVLKLTFNSSATSSVVNSVLQSISYRNSSEDPLSLLSFDWIFNDNFQDTNASGQHIVNITPLNDEPLLKVTSLDPSFTENSLAISLFSDANLSTVEVDQNITEINLTISNIESGLEILEINGTEINITNGESGTITNGSSYSVKVIGTDANLSISDQNITNSLINSIKYRSYSETPDITGSTRVISIYSIKDSGGVANGGSDINRSLNITSTVSITEVNDLPVLQIPTSISINENNATTILDINGSDKDNDNLTFSISGNNYNKFSINSTTGELSTEALNYEENSSYELNISLSDTQFETNSTLTVNVIDINEIPTISGVVSNQNVDDNSSIQPFSAVTLSDPENSNLSISILLDNKDKGVLSGSGLTDNGDGNYTISSNTISNIETTLQSLTFAPTENRVEAGQIDTTTFSIYLSDGVNLKLDNTTTVISTSIDDRPTLNTLNNITKGEDFIDFNLTLVGEDIDYSSSVIYSAISSDTSKVTTSVTGDQLVLTSVSGYGSIKITATATSNSVEVNQSFYLTVNGRPSINVENNSTDEDIDLAINLSQKIVDPENDTLTLSAESNNTQIALTSIDENGILLIKPVEDQSGVVSIEINASDLYNRASKTILVTINSVEDIPDTPDPADEDDVFVENPFEYTTIKETININGVDYVIFADQNYGGKLSVMKSINGSWEYIEEGVSSEEVLDISLSYNRKRGKLTIGYTTISGSEIIELTKGDL